MERALFSGWFFIVVVVVLHYLFPVFHSLTPELKSTIQMSKIILSWKTKLLETSPDTHRQPQAFVLISTGPFSSLGIPLET